MHLIHLELLYLLSLWWLLERVQIVKCYLCMWIWVKWSSLEIFCDICSNLRTEPLNAGYYTKWTIKLQLILLILWYCCRCEGFWIKLCLRWTLFMRCLALCLAQIAMTWRKCWFCATVYNNFFSFHSSQIVQDFADQLLNSFRICILCAWKWLLLNCCTDLFMGTFGAYIVQSTDSGQHS